MLKSNLYQIYPTMGCNLDCQHCFLFSSVRADKSVMSNEDFRTIVDKLALHFKNDTEANVAEVTIIGGEPTSVNPKFYLENMPYLREKFEEVGKTFSVMIVTNFTNINALDKYAHFFDIISTSYEYDRFDAQLIASYNNKKSAWWANLEKWISKGKKVAISIASSKETTEHWEEMMDLLYEKGVRFFQLNVMHPDGELMRGILTDEDYSSFQSQRKDILTDPSVKMASEFTPKEDQTIWSGFEAESDMYEGIAKWWLKKREEGDKELTVHPISSHIESLITGEGNTDVACPSSGALCVRTDGEVSGCTIEAGQNDMISYGNLIKESVDDVVNSQEAKEHLETLDSHHFECLTCEYYYFCKGGCTFRGLMWKRDADTDCHGLKKYLRYLDENKDKFKDLVNNFG